YCSAACGDTVTERRHGEGRNAKADPQNTYIHVYTHTHTYIDTLSFFLSFSLSRSLSRTHTHTHTHTHTQTHTHPRCQPPFHLLEYAPHLHTTGIFLPTESEGGMKGLKVL